MYPAMQSVCQPSFARTPERASALPLKGLQQIHSLRANAGSPVRAKVLPVCNAIGDALAGKTAKTTSAWP